eukprot:1355963-Amphidinium_carterae.1
MQRRGCDHFQQCTKELRVVMPSHAVSPQDVASCRCLQLMDSLKELNLDLAYFETEDLPLPIPKVPTKVNKRKR